MVAKKRNLSAYLILCSMAAVATAGCTNMEEMPGPGNGGPKICTREYMPVCGAKGYKRKTFSNACVANAAGYSVIKEGKCIR